MDLITSLNNDHFKFTSDALKTSLKMAIANYCKAINDKWSNIRQEELYELWNKLFDFNLEFRESKIIMLDRETLQPVNSSQLNNKQSTQLNKQTKSSNDNTYATILTRGYRKREKKNYGEYKFFHSKPVLTIQM